MKPEADRFIAKAAKLLDEAQRMLDVGLFDAAGRAAYLAAFHAAQALIFERDSKIAKSHRGVQVEFQRMTKGSPDVGPELRAFLSRGYNLKAVADYETDPDCTVSHEQATEAVATARRFVARLAELAEGAT